MHRAGESRAQLARAAKFRLRGSAFPGARRQLQLEVHRSIPTLPLVHERTAQRVRIKDRRAFRWDIQKMPDGGLSLSSRIGSAKIAGWAIIIPANQRGPRRYVFYTDLRSGIGSGFNHAQRTGCSKEAVPDRRPLTSCDR